MTVTSMVPCVSAARAQARTGHLGLALVDGLRRGDDHGALASDGATASCVYLGRFSPLESFGPWCGFPGPGCLLLGGTPLSPGFLGSPLTRVRSVCASSFRCRCVLVLVLSVVLSCIIFSARITHYPLFFFPSFGVPVPVPVPGSWFLVCPCRFSPYPRVAVFTLSLPCGSSTKGPVDI